MRPYRRRKGHLRTSGSSTVSGPFDSLSKLEEEPDERDFKDVAKESDEEPVDRSLVAEGEEVQLQSENGAHGDDARGDQLAPQALLDLLVDTRGRRRLLYGEPGLSTEREREETKVAV